MRGRHPQQPTCGAEDMRCRGGEGEESLCNHEGRNGNGNSNRERERKRKRKRNAPWPAECWPRGHGGEA